jgi:hypothetical protein
MANEFGIQFLQFLAMSRPSQEAYLSTARATQDHFGCEMREGYYESELGLRLLLVVGADSLLALRFSLAADAQEPLHRLWSVLFLLNEYPPDTTIDGVWREIQSLAASVLERNGMASSEPELPLEDLVRQVCFVVTKK